MGGYAGTFTDEDALITALRRGDERAFEWLLGTYDATLRRVAPQLRADRRDRGRGRPGHVIGVIRGIDDFEQRSSLKTWLYRILLNIARTKGVREHRTIPFSSAAGALSDGDEPMFDPEQFRPATPAEPYPGGWVSFPFAWEAQPDATLEAAETVESCARRSRSCPRLNEKCSPCATSRVGLPARSATRWSSPRRTNESCSIGAAPRCGGHSSSTSKA